MLRCRGSCPQGVRSEAEYNPAGELAAGLDAGGGVARAVGREGCWSWTRRAWPSGSGRERKRGVGKGGDGILRRWWRVSWWTLRFVTLLD
jgi:hypothetical protein